MVFKIVKSNTKNKRFTAIINNKKISFGSSIGSTYIDHGDEVKRTNYIARHKVNEDWTKINAGSLSRFILWGDSPDINVNIANYKKKFGL
jgi:hypothetical protein